MSPSREKESNSFIKRSLLKPADLNEEFMIVYVFIFFIFLILSSIMSIIATVLWRFTAIYEEKLTKYLIWMAGYKIYQMYE